MKLTEKIRKWFEPEPRKGEIVMSENVFFHLVHPLREGGVRITLDVVQNGDTVDIAMHGIENINVCLASFLTKGVSYAQQKYNEYMKNPDDTKERENPPRMR